jgi:A/G-specific adenine glycosylase
MIDSTEMRQRLRRWYEGERRELPWRATRDPYRIWVSEIMLQQTRVAAATPYYERFLAQFPNVEALAAASEDEVLTAWSGLGYYSRARNLLRAARLVVAGGGFPRDYDSIRALPGVGDYTAAAIASIAFGLAHAAVDGNVLRVLARVLAERGDIGTSKIKKRISNEAARLLDQRRPGEFNQALMELGATVCLPRLPQCARCPVATLCQARKRGLEHELPVKLRRAESVRVEKTLLLIRKGDRVLLRRRDARSSQMAGFWELPEAGLLPRAVLGEVAGTVYHAITNFRYRLTIVRASIRRIPSGFSWVSASQMERMPMSTQTRKALTGTSRVREPLD